MPIYRGRFAPSPTGPLHRGSLAAALASWLDARAAGGKWLIRMEDIDPPRERPGAAAAQLAALARFGLASDEPVLRQSQRSGAYERAVEQLAAADRTFICHCSRALRAAAGPNAPYPGTCRELALAPPGAVRLRVPAGSVAFEDRARGVVTQDVLASVGDFIIRRADGLWAYQLAVVVDDADQGITHVVRGDDLLDNTPRQILLQRALGLPTPRYLHIPLVRDAAGTKLSKHDGAAPLDEGNVMQELAMAWQHLGFAPLHAARPDQFLQRAVGAWRTRWSDGATLGAPR